jgi:hypothetical protein
MLDAVNYRAIEKFRDGRDYIIRAQRRDDNIIDASPPAGWIEKLLFAVPHSKAPLEEL